MCLHSPGCTAWVPFNLSEPLVTLQAALAGGRGGGGGVELILHGGYAAASFGWGLRLCGGCAGETRSRGHRLFVISLGSSVRPGVTPWTMG